MDSARYLEDNPLIGRRYNECIDINEYESIKSHQNEREAEIAQLKKIKEESNLMMEKVKRNKNSSEEESAAKSNKKNLLIDVTVEKE